MSSECFTSTAAVPCLVVKMIRFYRKCILYFCTIFFHNPSYQKMMGEWMARMLPLVYVIYSTLRRMDGPKNEVIASLNCLGTRQHATIQRVEEFLKVLLLSFQPNVVKQIYLKRMNIIYSQWKYEQN